MKKLSIFLVILTIASLIIGLGFFRQAYDDKCKLEDFENWREMENDWVCGDFGVMYLKMVGIIILHSILLSLIFIFDSIEKQKEVAA